MTIKELIDLCHHMHENNHWLQVTGARLQGKKRVRVGITEGPYVEVLDKELGVGRILPEKVLKWLRSTELSCASNPS